MKKKNRPEGYQFSNWHSYLPQLPGKKEPTYKRKKRGKRNTMTCMGAYISLNTHPNHTSRQVWSLGSICRDPFFLPAADEAQIPRSLLKGPKPIRPSGLQQQENTEEWFWAINQAQSPKPAHSTLKLRSAAMTPEHLKLLASRFQYLLIG